MEICAGEVVKCMLQILFAQTSEEFTRVQDFSKGLNVLKKHLQTINSDLEQAERREITNNRVKNWLKGLEDAAFDAKNVLDEYHYEDLRRKIQIQYKIKLKGCFNIPCYTTLALRWKMAHKIKDMNDKCETMNNEAGNYRPFGDDPKPVLETTSVYADPPVIGRENDEKEILDAITTSNDVLSVLPIVGMGGIGKTTLTRKIFKHPRTQNRFGERIWVCVSEKFDQKTLFKKILGLLNPKFDGDCMEIIVQQIQEILKHQRYLIVLDDLWNEEKEDWEDFKNTLVEMNSIEGNFIIVTTREEKLASICNRPRRLRSLKDSDCWSIIRTKAFQDNEVSEVSEQVESTGLEIARKCRGLPLAANVIGGVLRGKDEEEWNSIRQNGLSNHEDGRRTGVLQTLKLSYERLPSSSVKKCFAYCSIFIKDSVIYREDLIQLWMAVDLLQDNQESEGNAIFNDFLQNFFFQEPENDEYGNVISFKMHDFFHDLACLVSKSDHIFQVRHLATASIVEAQDIKEKDSHLRTLFSTSSVPDKILPGFKHLHVLKLSGAAIEELPTSIDKLKRLRYLDVSNNDRLTTLPESVCRLYFLQTLKIHDIVRFPEDLRFLINLRHLCFVNVDNRVMPREIGRLSHLQTLPSFYVSDKESRRIDELGKLTNLQGKLKIQNLELVMDETEAAKANMAEKQSIYELHFQWGSGDGAVDANATDANDESVLKELQPHQDLKGLTVEGFRGKRFPLWTTNMKINRGNDGQWVKFNQLIKIEFRNCRRCEEIPMLGHLPLLKYLWLLNLSSITSIRQSFYGESDGQGTRVSFPSLKILSIRNLPNLTKWEEARTSGMQVFPCLEYLEINSCDKLAHVPHLRGSRASLKEMKILDCPELRELPYDLGTLQSLESLKISNCKNLQSISYQNGQEGLRSP